MSHPPAAHADPLLAVVCDEDAPLAARREALRVLEPELDRARLDGLLELTRRSWTGGGNAGYGDFRFEVAQVCLGAAGRISGAPRLVTTLPPVPHAVEVRHPLVPWWPYRQRGHLQAGYGTSLYDAHWEYPVDGMGVRKDRLLVVEGKRRVPIARWCRQNGVVVFCFYCGQDVTDTVSSGCPARTHE